MIDISLSSLKNSALFTLSMRVYELILGVKTPEMGIDFYFNNFVTAYNKYKEAMEKSVLSSADVAAKDSFRDTIWVALRTHVKNYLRHPELAPKANVILAELDKNGSSVYDQSYETETAIIQSVCQTLEANFSTDLAAIQANIWFDLLKTANTDFEAAQRKLNMQQTAANQVDAATTARPQLDDALRKLFTFLPMQAEVTGNGALQELVNELQTEASRF